MLTTPGGARRRNPRLIPPSLIRTQDG